MEDNMRAVFSQAQNKEFIVNYFKLTEGQTVRQFISNALSWEEM